jgi:hypothetical protein
MVGAILVLGAGLTWDQRSAWMRAMMEGPPPIRIDGPVIWRGAESPWFMLRTTSWVSNTQAALLFSRPTAMEWGRRMNASAPLLNLERWTPDQRMKTCADYDRRPTAVEMAAICRASRGLHGVILREPVTGWPAVSFQTRAPYELLCRTPDDQLDGRSSRVFYLMPCP